MSQPGRSSVSAQAPILNSGVVLAEEAALRKILEPHIEAHGRHKVGYPIDNRENESTINHRHKPQSQPQMRENTSVVVVPGAFKAAETVGNASQDEELVSRCGDIQVPLEYIGNEEDRRHSIRADIADDHPRSSQVNLPEEMQEIPAKPKALSQFASCNETQPISTVSLNHASEIGFGVAPMVWTRSERRPDLSIKEVGHPGTSDDQTSGSEIQSILEQFDERANESDEQDVDSSMSDPTSSRVQHPPRKSSLEPLGSTSRSSGETPSDQTRPGTLPYSNEVLNRQQESTSPRPSNTVSLRSLSYSHVSRFGPFDNNEPASPKSPVSMQKSLPPAPDKESDLPFDFHRFLEQLRHRTADPVAKFLRSFLVEFGKKQWMVHEQVKIISDFLVFITSKMAQCEVWKEVSDAEFDNAKEGMEKLVMNRLYSQTFSPAIPPPVSSPPLKGKQKQVDKGFVSGRHGQHQEDIERDEILAQKVRIYGWIREEHLDIQCVGDSGRRFLTLAQQELLKIKSYRAPRDKVICVLNCCKVIFGLLRGSKYADTSADSFVPLLIYVVLQANPDHLVSNVQYILRFRNQDKLGGEAGYYLSSLMGAIQFIENLDRTALTISDEDFERNVEAAVSAIAERNRQEEQGMQSKSPTSEGADSGRVDSFIRESLADGKPHSGKSPVRLGTDIIEESAAMSGLLRSIQRPLSSIGRIFSEEVSSTHNTGNLRVQEVPAHPPETPRRLSPAVFQPPQNSSDMGQSTEDRRARTPRLNAADAAARQASAETAEAHRIQRAEHNDVVETLASMFPDLDRDIIDDVVLMKEGRVGLAVEACLALNS